MKILLVGNGIEIYYNNLFSKNEIIERMNSGDGNWDENVEKNLNEYYQKKFKSNLDFNTSDFKNISKAINSEGHEKSVEKIFEEISISIHNEEKIKKLANLFLAFLQDNSDKTAAKDAGRQLYNSLSIYDIILTTNYTDLLERVLSEYGNSDIPVVHLHGFYKADKNKCLLGLNKTESPQDTELYEYDKLNNIANKFSNLEYGFNSTDEKINIDVFGLSLSEDERIIGNIIRWISEVLSMKQVNRYWNSDGQAFWDGDNEKILRYLNELYSITYYWYDKNDKNAWEKICCNNEKENSHLYIKVDLMDRAYTDDEKWQAFLCWLENTSVRDVYNSMPDEVSANRMRLNGVFRCYISVDCSAINSSYFIRGDSGRRTIRIPEIGKYLDERIVPNEIKKIESGIYADLSDIQKADAINKLKKFLNYDI